MACPASYRCLAAIITELRPPEDSYEHSQYYSKDKELPNFPQRYSIL